MRPRLTAALALVALATIAIPDASAGRWRSRAVVAAPGVLYPGYGYYSFPWGYVIPTAPYAYPVVPVCQRRYPVARPWGVGWRETWVC